MYHQTNKKGVVLGTGNFSKDFKNIKLADILKKKFGVPVLIDNDVNLVLYLAHNHILYIKRATLARNELIQYIAFDRWRLKIKYQDLWFLHTPKYGVPLINCVIGFINIFDYFSFIIFELSARTEIQNFCFILTN